jgi:hypothetical protein
MIIINIYRKLAHVVIVQIIKDWKKVQQSYDSKLHKRLKIV